jgi:hypothetical protein
LDFFAAWVGVLLVSELLADILACESAGAMNSGDLENLAYEDEIPELGERSSDQESVWRALKVLWLKYGLRKVQ